MDYKALLRDVGRRIAEVRFARGLTQEQLAEHLGVSIRYYRRVEAGTAAVSLRQLARIAEALELSLAQVFTPPQTRESRPGRPRRKPSP